MFGFGVRSIYWKGEFNSCAYIQFAFNVNIAFNRFHLNFDQIQAKTFTFPRGGEACEGAKHFFAIDLTVEADAVIGNHDFNLVT